MKRWRCEETLRMVTRRQRPQFSLPYWLQSQERHINRQCFSPLGYSPSWATHAFFVTGVDEFEVVSAVSDSPALSVCHGLLLGLLSWCGNLCAVRRDQWWKQHWRLTTIRYIKARSIIPGESYLLVFLFKLLSWSRTPGNCIFAQLQFNSAGGIFEPYCKSWLNVAWLLVPVGLVWVFQKLMIYWDFHTQTSLGFTENSPKKTKYPVTMPCWCQRSEEILKLIERQRYSITTRYNRGLQKSISEP